jgi:hypothetical protein
MFFVVCASDEMLVKKLVPLRKKYKTEVEAKMRQVEAQGDRKLKLKLLEEHGFGKKSRILVLVVEIEVDLFKLVLWICGPILVYLSLSIPSVGS